MIDTEQQKLVQEQLEVIGIRHAPKQMTTERQVPDGRYVTMKDEPGIYYLLGIDIIENCNVRDTKMPDEFDYNRLQLIFLGKADTSEHLAEQIGWKVEEKVPQQNSTEEFPIHITMLRPGTSPISRPHLMQENGTP